MRRDVTSYVYYDFGTDYFGDFDIDFEVKIDSVTTQGNALICGVSNTIGTFNDMRGANDCLCSWAYGNDSDLRIYVSCYNEDNNDFYADGGTSSNTLYCTFQRSGTTLTLDIYSDAARTSTIDNLSVTCETGDKRYFYVLAAIDYLYPTDTITGHTQNFEIVSND